MGCMKSKDINCSKGGRNEPDQKAYRTETTEIAFCSTSTTPPRAGPTDWTRAFPEQEFKGILLLPTPGFPLLPPHPMPPPSQISSGKSTGCLFTAFSCKAISKYVACFCKVCPGETENLQDCFSLVLITCTATSCFREVLRGTGEGPVWEWGAACKF